MKEAEDHRSSDIDPLLIRLEEAEETLRAIRSGEVDALVIMGPTGEQVFTLKGADHAYRVIVEAMAEGALTLSIDGTILYCNRSFAELVKAPLQQVIGASVKNFFVSQDPLQTMLEQKTTGRAEGRIQTAEGRTVPVFASLNHVVIDETPCLSLIVADLTGPKRQATLLEEERMRSEEKVRESQRLAAMGTTAAVLAHEIANPLNGISARVQLMQRQLASQGLNPPVQGLLGNCLQELRTEIGRLGSLLNEFRSLARPLQLKLQPIDVCVLVAEVVQIVASESDELGIRIEQECPLELPRVEADADRLKQVMLNLFKNAIEAMPSGGKLKAKAYAQAEEVVIEITDSGPGIPEGVNIFELFTTTKPKGTGLGLAVVRQILSAHGGTIAYTTPRGEGTTFRIALPRH
jgi:PAS domain S-box-containing protein